LTSDHPEGRTRGVQTRCVNTLGVVLAALVLAGCLADNTYHPPGTVCRGFGLLDDCEAGLECCVTQAGADAVCAARGACLQQLAAGDYCNYQVNSCAPGLQCLPYCYKHMSCFGVGKCITCKDYCSTLPATGCMLILDIEKRCGCCGQGKSCAGPNQPLGDMGVYMQTCQARGAADAGVGGQ